MKSILFFIGLVFVLPLRAQHPDWQHKDLQKDSVFGISTEKAYAKILKHKRPRATVLVAVIDGGVDTAHEDLKQILWTNPNEIANGQDDDRNGYVDDLHGWNFLGGPKGDINHETLELTRLIRAQRSITPAIEADYDAQLAEAKGNLEGTKAFKEILDSILQKIGKENPAKEDFKHFEASTPGERHVREVVLNNLAENPDFTAFKKKVQDGIDRFQRELDYNLNLEYDPRPVVGDDIKDSVQRSYGNNNVTGPDAHHGTHVAGIIGALRNNNIGMNGIANDVRIMSVRVVPDGDERDKDVANGIRYAADNGARVINMSFGKAYSPYKSIVDEAVRYAISKDVLIVHAAGNDGKNLDSNANFPNRRYLVGGEAGAWIEVGASGEKNDSTLIAGFSNYGRITVDVFAPGVKIYSSLPGNQYAYYNGTSMASPVVAGLAALIREYYPKLTAPEVKDIILRSVVKSPVLADKCISGGVVNAYEALNLAKHYKRNKL